MRHASWPAFEEWRGREQARLVLLTTTGTTSYLDHGYGDGDVLMFGRELAGVPAAVHDGGRRAARDPDAARPALAQHRDGGAMVVGEAMRQTRT